MASAYDRTPPPTVPPEAAGRMPAHPYRPEPTDRLPRTGPSGPAFGIPSFAGFPMRAASGGKCRRIPRCGRPPAAGVAGYPTRGLPARRPAYDPKKNRTAPFDDPVAAFLPMPPEHLSRRCSLTIRGIPFSTVAATACTHPAHPRHAAAAQRHTTFDKPSEPGRLSGPAPSGRCRLPCSRRPLRRHKPAGVKRRPVRSPALAGTRAGQGASYRHRAGTPPTESDR